MDKSCGVRISVELPPLRYPKTRLENELNEKNPKYSYNLLLPGTYGQVTRDVDIYVVYDKENC